MHKQDERIAAISEWEIMLLQEDEPSDYSPLDLLPVSLSVRLKMLCMSIAEGNVMTAKMLFEDIPFDELYEMLALKKAYTYRPSQGA